jgi:hypothetical protein
VADDVDTLIAELREFVDVDATVALRLLNRRHRLAVARAQTYLAPFTLVETATAGLYARPASPEVVEFHSPLYVGPAGSAVPYSKGRETDFYAYQQGWLVWEGPGLFVVIADGVAVIPAPASGTLVQGTGACMPPDLVAGGAASTIKLDDDALDALVEGAAATELLRIGEGDPVSLEAKFTAMCEEQRLRQRRRLRGRGPGQIRVEGYTA